MLVGGMIRGVIRLSTPHDAHLYTELSDRTPVTALY